jgi:hypothetical protein
MKDCTNTFNRCARSLTILYEFIVKEFRRFYHRFIVELPEIFSTVLRKKASIGDSV